MKLSAQIIDALKFGLIMLLFSFLVFVVYSSGKKIGDNIRKEKPVTVS